MTSYNHLRSLTTSLDVLRPLITALRYRTTSHNLLQDLNLSYGIVRSSMTSETSSLHTTSYSQLLILTTTVTPKSYEQLHPTNTYELLRPPTTTYDLLRRIATPATLRQRWSLAVITARRSYDIVRSRNRSWGRMSSYDVVRVVLVNVRKET